jgi:holin
MGEHESPKPPFISDAYRLWLYVVSAGVLVCLGVWGVFDGDKIAALNFLFAAFFGVASKNISSKE